MERRKDHTLVLDVRKGAEIGRVATTAYFLLANFNVRRVVFVMNAKMVTCEPKDSVIEIEDRYWRRGRPPEGGGIQS